MPLQRKPCITSLWVWNAAGVAGVAEVSLWGDSAVPLTHCSLSQDYWRQWGLLNARGPAYCTCPGEGAASAHRKDGTLCGLEARICCEANPTAAWWLCERHVAHLKVASSKTKTQEKCNFFNGTGFSTLPNTSLNCSIIVYYHFGS